MKKFTGVCISGGILLTSVFLFIIHFIGKQHNASVVYLSVPLIMVITILFHGYLLQASKGDPKKFISKFIASSGIKLLLYLIVLVIYIFTNPGDAKMYLIFFLITYVMYTIIEIMAILRQLKK